VQVAVSLTSGAFQTGLLTYFTQRDLFSALMKVSAYNDMTGWFFVLTAQLIYDAQNPTDAILPLLLAGLLANYNKFEVRNPYQARFADFSHHDTISKVSICISGTCGILRDRYVAIQNDLPDSWSLGGTLSYVGLGSLAGAKPLPAAPTEDEAKAMFAEQ